MNKKNFNALTIISIILFLTVIVLALKLSSVSLFEGRIEENPNGGVVTATQNWLVYSDDSCITSTAVAAGTIKDYSNELFAQGNIKDFVNEGEKITLEFSHEIIVKKGSTEIKYYFVGGYYITSNTK